MEIFANKVCKNWVEKCNSRFFADYNFVLVRRHLLHVSLAAVHGDLHNLQAWAPGNNGRRLFPVSLPNVSLACNGALHV